MTSVRERPVLLVSGAAQGIGRAVSVSATERGCQVILTARSKDRRIQDLLGQLRSLGSAPMFVPCDFSNDDEIAGLFQLINKECSSLDGIAHCAGMYSEGLLGRNSRQDLESIFSINVFSAIRVVEYGAKLMRRQRSGSIVLVASAVGIQGMEGQSAYSASKSALHGLVKSASRELGSSGIRVNSVVPGVIETPFIEKVSREKLDDMARQTSLGRFGSAPEVAACIQFLLSNDSSFVTGHELVVDGGLHF